MYTDQKTVLVSAAAGSGKTSVMTGRVTQLVRDGTDIRNMLVLTFTNAAAAEMKRRISRGLYAAAQQAGGERLHQQSELADAADISTFHSFCARLIRDRYDFAGVSPNFRILGDAEAKALKNETLRDYYDVLYENDDADFHRLLARFAPRANDAVLMDWTMKIYDRMMGKADPYNWAERSIATPAAQRMEEVRGTYEGLMVESLEDAADIMDVCAGMVEGCVPEQAQADAAVAREARRIAAEARDGFAAAREKHVGFKIPPIPRGSHENVSELTGKLRTEARALVKAFFADSVYEGFETGEALRQMEHTARDVRALVEMVRVFQRMYGVKKQQANALDYEDLQHTALKVLRENPGLYRYSYIFVDEYQDTNPVQEEIISLVEADSVFMVGDVKQSIYKFRQAEPGIFREKAKVFLDAGEGGVIRMNENFRSAGAVIDAVNFVMKNIMSETLGEVEYAEHEALLAQRAGGSTKILLCEQGDEDKQETQADMIAQRVAHDLAAPYEDGAQVLPGDIAVLVRSRSPLVTELVRALSIRGIPHCVAMHDMRDTQETNLLVNLLKLVCNPAQDIPLLAVMRSFVGGFGERDFARIRLHAKSDIPFFRAVEAYRAQGDGELQARVEAFLDEIKQLSALAAAMETGDFIACIVEKYDFYIWHMGRQNGVEKWGVFSAFVDQLKEMAQTTGNSLYLLLDALAETKRREGGYVVAAGNVKRSDGVNIMTIHGSKGLEFPVVYVAGLNRRFNAKDHTGDLLLDNDMGISVRYVDEQKREKCDTAENIVMRRKAAAESRSEELRMLYVAMTRAKERLYLCGHMDGKSRHKWEALKGRYHRAGCMMDWIMAANSAGEGLDVEIAERAEAAGEKTPFDFRQYTDAMTAQYVPAKIITMPVAVRVPAKVSVSAVKAASAGGIRSFLTPVHETDEISGAQLGTLVHGVMERAVRKGDIDGTIADMLDKKLIGQAEADAVIKNRYMVEGFLKSGLYKRMAASPQAIYEQRFNLLVPAADIGYPGNGNMTVQGILDAAFMENEKWVLLDYKTDRVDGDGIKKAADGYAVQLQLYARALEQITGVGVAEMHLYFLRPGEDVLVYTNSI